MTAPVKSGLPALGLAVTLSGTAMAGVEEPVDLSEVPAEVMEVAKANMTDLKLADVDAVTEADGIIVDDEVVDDDSIAVVYEELGEVTFVSANTETEEDGSYVYEIQGTVPDGRKVEIDIFPNGSIEEIEIEFLIEDVPGLVIKALEEKVPGFQPDFIEASHSPSMKVFAYEFVGNVGDSKMDLEASADGRRIIVADQ